MQLDGGMERRMGIMSYRHYLLAGLLILQGAFAYSVHAGQIVTKNSRHFIEAIPQGEQVRFVLEAVGDTSNNLAGSYPKVDFVSIRVDVNKNGRVDEGVDLAYGTAGGSKDKICTQYLITETSSSGCGKHNSQAKLKVSFKSTSQAAKPHPVWEFTIPKSELSKDGKLAHMMFKFHEAGHGYTRYPESGRANVSFSQVLSIRLTPLTIARIQAPGTLRMNNLRLLQGVTLLSGSSKQLVKNDQHVITGRRQGDRIHFTIEAVGDRTDNLSGEYPQLDFAGIRVDFNHNRRVDERVDVAYGTANGSKDKICTQYLLSEASSTGCGGFKSEARLKVAFKSTANAPHKHPVWNYSIPVKELSRDDSVAHLIFRIHQSGKGYTTYPKRANRSFRKTLAFELRPSRASEPAPAPVDEEPVVEEPPEVVRHDTRPPSITLTEPTTEADARLTHAGRKVMVRGRVEDESGVYEVLVKDAEAAVDDSGQFWREVKLGYGENLINVRASDVHENWQEQSFVVIRQGGDSPPEGDEGRGIDSAEDQSEDQPASEGTYYALMVGVQEYQNPDINDLNYPVSDAIRLRDVLVEEYGFAEANVTTLENPTEDELLSAFVQLRKKVTDKDNVVIFYAGHGLWNEQIEQGYWLPSDSDDDTPSRWVSNSDIRDFIKSIPSRHTLLITDACFGGGIFKGRGIEEADRAIQVLHSTPSRKAITSGVLTEVPDRSVFLDYLVDRLKNHPQSWLTARQLFAELQEPVINNSPITPQYGVIFGADDEGGEFVFFKQQH
jgi:hypothetical protein